MSENAHQVSCVIALEEPTFLLCKQFHEEDCHLESAYTRHVTEVIELIQGKWTVQILCAKRAHPVRLSELKRQIPSTSKKALTASLRLFEAARVVVRRDLSSSVLHVEYELVESMRVPLVGLLDHLSKWGRFYESETSSHM